MSAVPLLTPIARRPPQMKSASANAQMKDVTPGSILGGRKCTRGGYRLHASFMSRGVALEQRARTPRVRAGPEIRRAGCAFVHRLR
jgi:hypothetical protein